MPSEKSDWWADVVLNLARGQAPPTISGLEVSLWHVVPNKQGTGGTEVASGGYARRAFSLTAPVANDPSGRKVSNTAAINFPQATADYPDKVRGWAIHRTDGAKELLYIHSLTPQQERTVLQGDVPRFGPGELVIAED
ncbi:MAG: phage tail fiber protein [Chloroflexota bacterium]